MRQWTRGDVQWSGGTSDPRGQRSRNFVPSPSGPASALVRLLPKIMALRCLAQSIRLHRVSGGPAWSEGHCLRIRATMSHPSWPTGQILRKAAAPPRAFAALATCAPLSGCVLSAGEPELGCYNSTALTTRMSAWEAATGVLFCCVVPVCVCVSLRCQSVSDCGHSTRQGWPCEPG